jgi:chromosome partitioning protein
MNAKMTIEDAARTLSQTEAVVAYRLEKLGLPFSRVEGQIVFGFDVAQKLFQMDIPPRVMVFQVVKGGTGKTSLVHELAIRANLYGLKVLCIDMDQQGNLTNVFNQDAEAGPIMVDSLVEGYALQECIVSVSPGLDLIPSRIENSMLDEVIRLKKIPLETVYRDDFQSFKSAYDLIFVDCPPSLGQSVTAIALSADWVISPVPPERFALEGLKGTQQSVQALNTTYGLDIHFGIVLNKFDSKTNAAQEEAVKSLRTNPNYQGKFLKNYVRLSQDFPDATARSQSVFAKIEPSNAKDDIDSLVLELLQLKLPENIQLIARTKTSMRTVRAPSPVF